MNGRTARKLLAIGKAGRCYHLIVRLSKSQLGLVEPERVTFADMREVFEGYWESSDMGTCIRIGNVSGGMNPTSYAQPIWECPVAVEQTSYGWTWWEGWRGVLQSNGGVIRTPIDEAIVRQYRERELWFRALGSAHSILRLFSGACAIGVHRWETSGDSLFIRYRMKVRYRKGKLWFCSALSQAMKAAKKYGINARVVALQTANSDLG